MRSVNPNLRVNKESRTSPVLFSHRLVLDLLIFMNRSVVLIVFLLGLFLAGGAALYISGQKTTQIEKENIAAGNPSEALGATEEMAIGHDVSFTFTEEGRKKWEMLVDLAHYDNEGTEAELKGVKGEFYNPDGKILATFSAPKGHYNGESNRFQLSERVTVKGQGDEGFHLEGDVLDWGSGKPKISVSGNVKVTLPNGGKSTAQRCLFTPNFAYIQLSGGSTTALSM